MARPAKEGTAEGLDEAEGIASTATTSQCAEVSGAMAEVMSALTPGVTSSAGNCCRSGAELGLESVDHGPVSTYA